MLIIADSMFIDHTEISVKAGNGGRGCNSFFWINGRKKRPDGGNGGDGGSIILRSDRNVQTLVDFHYRKHFKAEDGKNGGSSNKKGANGRDCIINVPAGTVIKDKYEDIIYCDLKSHNQSALLIKGGSAGRGNSRFRDATAGDEGEEKEIILELKLIADAAIIGFPNAGKSSLISIISNAKSKIAAYPFTTKTPVLGMVRMDNERSFIVCDIPGLIEGAHLGKGLGHTFLRHIERTKLLIHMIDMANAETREPFRDFKAINAELKMYSPGLLDKPQLIAANKMDLTEADVNLKKFRKKIKKTVYPISCATGEGIPKLLEAIYKKLQQNT